MIRRVRMTALAQEDVRLAHRWYAAHHAELGQAFVDEFDRQSARIGEAPAS